MDGIASSLTKNMRNSVELIKIATLDSNRIPLAGDPIKPRNHMRNLDQLFAALDQSAFRRNFHLRAKELVYLHSKSLPVVLEHAEDFIARRLAPAVIPNDGKQTPFRGHPVFIAQHATACCCRGCLEKWHRIPHGRELTPEETAYVITVLERWLREEMAGAP